MTVLAAAAKTTQKLFRDLRQGTAKKREAAAKALAPIDRAGACEALREVLAATKKAATRAVIARSLHWVADADAAQFLAKNDEFSLEPTRFGSSVLASLFRAVDVAAFEDVDQARHYLTRIGLLSEPIARPATPRGEGEEDYREAIVDRMLNVIDDPRLVALHQEAARAIRQAELRRGSEALLARWEAQMAGAVAGGGRDRDRDRDRVIDAFASWVRLGCPVNAQNRADRMLLLHESLIDALKQSQSTRSAADLSALDELFASSASSVPEVHVHDLLLAVIQFARLPKMKTALAKRLVEITRGTQSLIKLIENGRLEVCVPFAGDALAASGAAGARAVLARHQRMAKPILVKALKALDAKDIYDFIEPRMNDQDDWFGILLGGAPETLRDPRWIATGRAIFAKQSRAHKNEDQAVWGRFSDRGRDMFLAIARDPRNESRSKAVEALADFAAQAQDRIQKRYALYALGQTKHPNATTALVAALNDPDIGDAVPLICTALGECGDTRAIKILEQQLGGPHKAFVEAALFHIKSRMKQIHHDVLLAACQDEDPVIADLAQRARDGEDDAAIVLEDALRDRGRL